MPVVGISALAGVGQGHHRGYSKWNLVEGSIAALLRHLQRSPWETAGAKVPVLLRIFGDAKEWRLGPMSGVRRFV